MPRTGCRRNPPPPSPARQGRTTWRTCPSTSRSWGTWRSTSSPPSATAAACPTPPSPASSGYRPKRARRYTTPSSSTSPCPWCPASSTGSAPASTCWDAAPLDEPGRYDLITAFDAIHDQAQPTRVLRAIAEALRPDGVFLMVDIAASSNLHENIDHPLGPALYAVSTMHCMTVSLALNGEGLGTMWGEQLARQKLAEGVRAVPGVSLNARRLDDAGFDELKRCDALILGSPNWSGVTGKLKDWMDHSGDLWETGELAGKGGAAFPPRWG